MPYIERTIKIPGHYRIVKITVSGKEKETRKWTEGYYKKIRVWIPPRKSQFSNGGKTAP